MTAPISDTQPVNIWDLIQIKDHFEGEIPPVNKLIIIDSFKNRPLKRQIILSVYTQKVDTDGVQYIPIVSIDKASGFQFLLQEQTIPRSTDYFGTWDESSRCLADKERIQLLLHYVARSLPAQSKRSIMFSVLESVIRIFPALDDKDLEIFESVIDTL